MHLSILKIAKFKDPNKRWYYNFISKGHMDQAHVISSYFVCHGSEE